MNWRQTTKRRLVGWGEDLHKSAFAGLMILAFADLSSVGKRFHGVPQ